MIDGLCKKKTDSKQPKLALLQRPSSAQRRLVASQYVYARSAGEPAKRPESIRRLIYNSGEFMNKTISICLIIVAVINLLPLAGVLSAEKLQRAYTITLSSNDLVILMRHRALLFGVLGGFIFYSAFYPIYQNAAMTMAAISMLGYVVLVYLVGGYNQSLYKVLLVDFVGLAVLCLAVSLKFINKQG